MVLVVYAYCGRVLLFLLLGGFWFVRDIDVHGDE